MQIRLYLISNMTHILLEIKYNTTEYVLYDKNRGESIIKSWCEYNNHHLVMPPLTHVFPTANEKKTEDVIEGFFHSPLYSIRNGPYKDYKTPSSEIPSSETLGGNWYNGYTSIGMLKESHISIHTYPEYNSIQIDFFSCKELNKRQNVEFIERVFKKSEATKFDLQFITRSVV